MRPIGAEEDSDVRILDRSFLALIIASAAACSAGDTNPAGTGATEAKDLSLSSAPESADRLQVFPTLKFTPVASADPKSPGISVPTALPPEFIETVAAQGSLPVENPASVVQPGGATVTIPFYGYIGNGPMLPAPGDLPSSTHLVEATKTEPDKNTYLVLRNQTGADASYDYGTHFLFQGHEGGETGSITRVNLDADQAHRVTIMASTFKDGRPLPNIDGSTWDPFAQKLIFTTEDGSTGAVSALQASLEFPSLVEPLNGSFGRGAYEGVQNDSDGNVWLVEDSGGPTSSQFPHSKQPNSFVFRFVPAHAGNLTSGKLQALQVVSLRTGQPIVFHDGQSAADASSPDVADLHAYGTSFKTHWVTVHDTSTDGTADFDANALAKAKLATPFKRPENGQFRPGTRFDEFYFDETGDTDARTEVGAAFGGFGSIFKLAQRSPSADDGTLSLLYRGDEAHAGFDNVGFVSHDQVVFVEDAGDTLHTQRNGLDSAWLFDVRTDYSTGAQPPRFFAEGRDPSATLDSAFGAFDGFQNEGDNEITGFHVSNGDPTRDGILGAQIPALFVGGWRAFYTQQHGENFTWEILPKP
jgi:hypothetical protein